MIRGVNKNIIEISDTGNNNFERAILFIRPQTGQEDSEQLRRNAKEFLSGLKLRPRFYQSARFPAAAAKLAVAAAAGAAVAVMVIELI